MNTSQKNQNSLHNRVNAYLRGKPATHIIDQSEEMTFEALSEQLEKAEKDLRTVQLRVDRLRWELAKAKS